MAPPRINKTRAVREQMEAEQRMQGESPAPVREPNPIEEAKKNLDELIAHEALAKETTVFLEAISPAREKTEDQLSDRIYDWFKHQGFWPVWWDPGVAASPFVAEENEEHQITISLAEYIRLKKMEKLGLVVTEVAETMEAVRKGDRDNEGEELADIDVRLHDYKGGFGFTGRSNPFAKSAVESFFEKMLKNLQRPFRHGKKF